MVQLIPSFISRHNQIQWTFLYGRIIKKVKSKGVRFYILDLWTLPFPVEYVEYYVYSHHKEENNEHVIAMRAKKAFIVASGCVQLYIHVQQLKVSMGTNVLNYNPVA